MATTPNITPTLVKRIVKKASDGKLKFKIAAFAFSKKGNLLGKSVNSISDFVSYEKFAERCAAGINCKYSGSHAEMMLMKKYGKRISSILIARVGHSGELRPIEPCRMCSSVAKKLGIRIYSVK